MACKYLHIVNGYTPPSTGTSLALTVSNSIGVLADKTKFCMKVCTSIPDTYDTYTVTVPIDSSAVPVWDKYGNPLTVGELKRGVIYQGYYGDTSPHVIVNAPKFTGCGCNV